MRRRRRDAATVARRCIEMSVGADDASALGDGRAGRGLRPSSRIRSSLLRSRPPVQCVRRYLRREHMRLPSGSQERNIVHNLLGSNMTSTRFPPVSVVPASGRRGGSPGAAPVREVRAASATAGSRLALSSLIDAFCRSTAGAAAAALRGPPSPTYPMAPAVCPRISAPPPRAGPAVGSISSRMSAISVSVVRMSPATDAAFRTAL